MGRNRNFRFRVKISLHMEWNGSNGLLIPGAAGIVIPMVNTGKEMEAIIENALYPPSGIRSFGPSQAFFGDLNLASSVQTYFEKS